MGEYEMKGSAKQILGEPKEIIYKIFVILLSNLLAAAGQISGLGDRCADGAGRSGR